MTSIQKPPLICISCSSKPCEKVDDLTFDICKYGIAFVKRNGKVERKEPQILLSNISRNLRHEINPILQTIIEQTTKLDPSLSIKAIDINNPLSVIIGSTVILDNFIQMITGVHEFHSLPEVTSSTPIRLKKTANLYYIIYAILKEEERAKELRINNLIPEHYMVTVGSDFIKYIIAVLIDNAWKYSVDNSVLTINITRLKNGRSQIRLTNESKTLAPDLNVFDLGIKANENSKGFGYGLYWAKLLEFHYNAIVHQVEDVEDRFSLTHRQIESADPRYSFQEFTLNNVITQEK